MALMPDKHICNPLFKVSKQVIGVRSIRDEVKTIIDQQKGRDRAIGELHPR